MQQFKEIIFGYLKKYWIVILVLPILIYSINEIGFSNTLLLPIYIPIKALENIGTTLENPFVELGIIIIFFIYVASNSIKDEIKKNKCNCRGNDYE